VYRFDAGSTELKARIAVPDPVAIAAGPRAVWVASHTGKVFRIDPASNAVVETIPVGHAPAGIALVDDTVWVSVDNQRF